MDTPRKTTELADLASLPPSTVGLLPNTPMEHAPFRAVGVAQDGVAAGCRRVLGCWALSGATGFHVPDDGEPTTEVAAEGSYPDRDSWRSAGSVHLPEVSPGCVLRARVLCIGSGQTQVENPPGTWEPGGPSGAFRLRCRWTADDGTTIGPVDVHVDLPASPVADAAVPVGDAAYWIALQQLELEMRPDDLEDDAVAVVWSERAAVEVELLLRGAPRLVAVVLHEQPVRVAYDHDEPGPAAVNGASAAEVPQTSRPQVAAANGTTYEEHRFGTRRLATTATRQSQLGPHVAELLAWHEAEADFSTVDVGPVVISSSTFVDVLEQTETAYDAERPGMLVAAATAQQHHLCDAGLVLGNDTAALPDTAVIPARVLVEARVTGAANLATIRVQSGLYEWIDVDVDGLVYATYEATGYLEAQAAPDHPSAVLQVFGRVDADTLEIRAITVGFGPEVSP